MYEMARLSVKWGNAKMAMEKEQAKRRPSNKKVLKHWRVMCECRAKLYSEYNITTISLDN